MKIFFLAQFYFDLHKPILAELEKQGHEVFLVQDKKLPFDPNMTSDSSSCRSRRRFLRSIFRTEKNYWRKLIASDSRYNEKYDLLLCINGVSFHPFLLAHLKIKNPDIKTSLYLWDTIKYYDFLRYKECFDRILTFDIDDANNNENVGVLPSYWFPTPPRDIKYKLFVVGSDHDDRISIIESVYNQLKDANLPAFIRVVVREPQPLPLIIRLMGHRKALYQKRVEDFERKKKLPFTSEEKVPVEDVVRYIDESECILDTDMPIQTGATERVIWTLARGKKIISTNYNLRQMPFYNDRQIKFIDRKNPVVDIDFLKKNEAFPMTDEIESLRVDKWIHKLIDF